MRSEDREAVSMVHGGFFRNMRPASTAKQLVRFIDPDPLWESGADAVVDDARSGDGT